MTKLQLSTYDWSELMNEGVDFPDDRKIQRIAIIGDKIIIISSEDKTIQEFKEMFESIVTLVPQMISDLKEKITSEDETSLRWEDL